MSWIEGEGDLNPINPSAEDIEERARRCLDCFSMLVLVGLLGSSTIIDVRGWASDGEPGNMDFGVLCPLSSGLLIESPSWPSVRMIVALTWIVSDFDVTSIPGLLKVLKRLLSSLPILPLDTFRGGVLVRVSRLSKLRSEALLIALPRKKGSSLMLEDALLGGV